MTRVSDHYGLGVGQGSLDFVDVDIENDVPVFIDPLSIRLQHGAWAEECQELIRSFFEVLLHTASTGDVTGQATLLAATSEPNETHLGMSRGKSNGRGLGPGKKGQEIVEALTRSKAGKTGLLQDLEDAALLVPGVGRDIISDITTNIIRGPLIEYTQNMCDHYKIPTVKQHAGLVWNSATKTFTEVERNLPRIDDRHLILVPKSIVRIDSSVDTGKYYRGFLRPYYEAIELERKGSPFVDILTNGRKKVLKGKLDKSLGTDKESVAKHTLKYPTALDRYKKSLTPSKNPPLDQETFENELSAPPVDFQELLDALEAIAPGKKGATAYHRAAVDICNALFEPSLGNHKIEQQIHDGRKRLDIRYDNMAVFGFFKWVGTHYSAATIPVECKNYVADPKNEELDQLSGRFGTDRGRVGILLCRQVTDRATLMARCRDTAKDGRGYIIVLDDDDLRILVKQKIESLGQPARLRDTFPLIRERFDLLIN